MNGVTIGMIKIMRTDKDSLAPLPSYGTPGAAGLDIYLPEDVFLQEGQNVYVPLGFATALPVGHVAIIVPRSGVGVKYGLDLINSVGVIDADYRGEWRAYLRLKSTGAKDRVVHLPKHSRALQAIVFPVPRMMTSLVDSLDDTERGEGGFGSTGE